MSQLQLRASADKSGALSLNATVAFGDLEAKEGQPSKRATFSIVAYTGGALRTSSFFRPVVIDLSGLRATQQIPILLDHDPAQIVGQATRVNVANGQVRVEGIVTGDDEPAQKVLSHAKNGFKWAASVGVSIDRLEAIAENTTVKVNGREFSGPLLVARTARLGETSFVAIGADEGASADIAASAAGDNHMSFKEWLAANGWSDESALSEAQLKTLKAAWEASTKAAVPKTPAVAAPVTVPATAPAPAPAPAGTTVVDPTDMRAAMRTDAAQELHRISKIRACFGDRHAELCAQAVGEGWSFERAENAYLKAENDRIKDERPKLAVFSSGKDKGASSASAIEAALMQTYRFVPEDRLAKLYKPEVLEAATGKHLRGMTLAGLLFEVIHAAGMHARPGRVDNDTIETALRADRQLRAAGEFSTLSLSGILSNVANKTLLDRFMAMETVIPLIAHERDATDFKEFKTYRLDGDGSFSEVGATGELKHISLKETEFANQLKTHGGMIALTRVMMTNDDLGAFLQIPLLFAELALYARELAAFTVLLGNAGSFFSTGNGNYFEGADSNLTIDSLETARKMFRELKNANNQFIMQSPRRVLVPPSLESKSARIFKSEFVNETTTAGKPSAQANPHQGLFQPVVSPFLGTASGISGSSDTAWYLLAENLAGVGSAVLQVAYLRGRRSPVLESAETDFHTLGMQWRSYWDFGVALLEKRAGVKSKGAA